MKKGSCINNSDCGTLNNGTAICNSSYACVLKCNAGFYLDGTECKTNNDKNCGEKNKSCEKKHCKPGTNSCVACTQASHCSIANATTQTCTSDNTCTVQVCKSGFEPSSDSSSCSQCNEGTYSPQGVGCMICGNNEYTNSKGQSSCLSCPDYQTNNSDHTGCVCADEYLSCGTSDLKCLKQGDGWGTDEWTEASCKDNCTDESCVSGKKCNKSETAYTCSD